MRARRTVLLALGILMVFGLAAYSSAKDWSNTLGGKTPNVTYMTFEGQPGPHQVFHDDSGVEVGRMNVLSFSTTPPKTGVHTQATTLNPRGTTVIVKQVDSTSPQLQRLLASGKIIPRLVLTTASDLSGTSKSILHQEVFTNAKITKIGATPTTSGVGLAHASGHATQQITISWETHEIKV